MARDFSKHPFGRYRKDSDRSGEAFRDDILWPALNEREKVIVDLDGTIGKYGSSFFEEAFGGLVRNHGLAADELRSRLEIRSSEDATWVAECWQYISDADK